MTPEQIFERDGALSPVDILDPAACAEARARVEEFLTRIDWRLDAMNRHKPHLYLKWVNDLARHPRILEIIRPILGEDILLWYSVVFVKSANSSGEVPWHQDSTYWALNEDKGLTVWLALNDVNEANGCVEYLPGSHRWPQVAHEIDNRPENMLARGQKIFGFESGKTSKFNLRAGQASIHHPSLLHASRANRSNEPRLGIAFRYIPATNFPRTLTWLARSATLVAGQLRHRKFIEDLIPRYDYDPQCVRRHRRSVWVAAIHTLFGDDSRSWSRKLWDLAPILGSKKTIDYLRNKGLPVAQSHDS